MKKEDKEKLITDLKYKYIQSLDNDSAEGFYRKLGFLGALIAFIISIGWINPQDLNSDVLMVAFLFLIYILHLNNQYSKYVDDLYEELFLAIKKDRLLEFEVKRRNWFERNVFYKQQDRQIKNRP